MKVQNYKFGSSVLYSFFSEFLFIFPCVKILFLICTYIFIFLKISLCWHLLMLKWKSIWKWLYQYCVEGGYQYSSMHFFYISSSKSNQLPSFPSTDSYPVFYCISLWSAPALLLSKYFQQKSYVLDYYFQNVLTCFFLYLNPPVPGRIVTLVLVILFSLFITFPNLG